MFRLQVVHCQSKKWVLTVECIVNFILPWSVFLLSSSSVSSSTSESIGTFGDFKCRVVEESPIGTQVCDLLDIFANYGTHLSVGGTALATNMGVQNSKITVLNEIQKFVVIGAKLMTRGRIDREQFIHENGCQKQNLKTERLLQDDDEDLPSKISCIIILEFAIQVQNQGFQPTLINVPVFIQDINDNIPRFDQHTSGLRLEISEDKAADAGLKSFKNEIKDKRLHRREVAVLPLARDLDYGLNGTVAYKLEGPDAELFELDDGLNVYVPHHSDSGDLPPNIKHLRLISKYELDRETKVEHRLFLTAYDQCSILSVRQTAQLPIIIHIKEVNEYSPQFDLGLEDKKRSSLVDSWVNRETRIHSKVTARHVDEQLREMSSNANAGSSLTLEIPEDIIVGSRLYRVLAVDLDSPDIRQLDPNSHQATNIHYYIAQSADLGVKRYFRIGKDDGWITLLHQLDYESGPRSYIMPVIAVDTGRPQMTSTLTLTFRVADVNDEPPLITVRGIEPLHAGHAVSHSMAQFLDAQNPTRFQTLMVQENLPAGTFVAKISAKDRDTGAAGEVGCHLTEPEAYKQQSVQHITASIGGDQIDFMLVESDVSTNPKKIADEIISSKRHDKEYMLLTRRELDRENKAWYFLLLICHDYAGEDLLTNMHYSSQVNSLDNKEKRLSSTRLLKIIVTDVNDNGPHFDRIRYDAKVAENSNDGTEILRLLASDKDEPGTGSQIFYRFANTDELKNMSKTKPDMSEIEQLFVLDKLSGSLKTTKTKLDRETRDSYQIPVVAYDSEFPNRTSLAWIHVQVTDVNDNIPHLNGNFTFWIDEEGSILDQVGGTRVSNSRHQIFVGQVTGEDLDLEKNGQISFSLGNEIKPIMRKSPHWIIRQDGMLFVQPSSSGSLDREIQPSYEIPVILTDNGKPSLSSTATVTVSLKDINDNAPKFINPPMIDYQMLDSINPSDSSHNSMGLLPSVPNEQLRIVESSSPGTLIYTVQAEDLDEGDNGKISYRLEPYEGFWQLAYSRKFNNSLEQTNHSLDYFIIGQESGEIRLNRPISGNDGKIPKRLILFAEDHGKPARKSYAFLNIQLGSEEIRSLKGISGSGNTGAILTNLDATGSINQLHSYPSTSQRNIKSGTHDYLGRLDLKHSGSALKNSHSYANEKHNELQNDRNYLTHKRNTDLGFSRTSELITGLGIGLVIVILVCLLLLVTYAMHGNHGLRHPRMSTQTRRSRTKKLNNLSDSWHQGNNKLNPDNEINGKKLFFAQKMKAIRNVFHSVLDTRSQEQPSKQIEKTATEQINSNSDTDISHTVRLTMHSSPNNPQTYFQTDSSTRLLYSDNSPRNSFPIKQYNKLNDGVNTPNVFPQLSKFSTMPSIEQSRSTPRTDALMQVSLTSGPPLPWSVDCGECVTGFVPSAFVPDYMTLNRSGTSPSIGPNENCYYSLNVPRLLPRPISPINSPNTGQLPHQRQHQQQQQQQPIRMVKMTNCQPNQSTNIRHPKSSSIDLKLLDQNPNNLLRGPPELQKFNSNLISNEVGLGKIDKHPSDSSCANIPNKFAKSITGKDSSFV